MLVTHVRPGALCGRKVYDTEGRYLGQVIAIAIRRDGVGKVVVHKSALKRGLCAKSS
jgi:sporulation protein YlmC with PRC-barrel domain